MVGSLRPLPPPSGTDRGAIPLPRRPLNPDAPRPPGPPPHGPEAVRHWYENELGWATVPASAGFPVRLIVGRDFDVLEVAAEAGRAGLRHLAPGSPVAVQGDRMRLLVAVGGAEELPGLLEWLEWGGLPLDLTATGEGGLMDAPPPPGAGPWTTAHRPDDLQGAAVWMRPPEPGCEVEASLPAMPALGGGGDAPDLVRLVDTVATWCHRSRLRR
ncbi:SCO3374 family protein [Streptomyces sp. NPDC091279]|uniref:SCO3374 family protein n=1 Tax=Streptomyces sp. NPDC091279 TaxID=3365983 RepID=UPI003828F610